jgi:CubicO group peptidase (beta-lactamase class C family)
MLNDKIAAIDRFLLEQLKNKRFPGAVCWIGNLNMTFLYEKYGCRQILPSPKPMLEDTIFDLASLTKPLVTAVSVMKLLAAKKILLDDRIDKFIPEFKGLANGSKTIRQLLTHTAGLPAWYPLYSIHPGNRLFYLADAATGKGEVVYSCLGYIILGKIVERVARTKLDLFFQDIIKGLSLKNTMFRPDKRLASIAATENGDRYERIKCKPLGLRPAAGWRNYLIRGEAHDGNCFYGYRGVAGNAGLFSNVPDLVRFMRALIGAEIIPLSSLKLMTTNLTGAKNPRGLGWKLDIYPGKLSPKAYGHTGFTGTMLCYDPLKDLLAILLTNDIHPYARPDNMPPIRRRLMKIISKIFIA